jgi:hypothetical protein
MWGFKQRIESKVRIHAPRQRVWEVLSDLAGYATWNPFFCEAEGALVPGKSVSIHVQTPAGKHFRFAPRIVAVEPGEAWSWRGTLLMPGIFDGLHTFRLIEEQAGCTVFEQTESFAGALVPLANCASFKAGWQAMEAGLKQRVEGSGERVPSTPA